MKRFLATTAILIAGSLAMLLVAGAVFFAGLWDEASWRQKLVVEVETPGGVVTGSSVQKADFSRANFNVPAGPSAGFKLTGEAVVVDLGEGRYLFALLQGAARLAPRTFYNLHENTNEAAIDAVLAMPRGVARPVPPEALPVFVTFTDIGDPMTVARVDPENLAATSGPGYRLKSITLEITDEPVTKGQVENVLVWFEATAGRMLDGERTSYLGAPNPLANRLSKHDFIRN